MLREKTVIKMLQKLEDGMPDHLWIFCDGIYLYLMRKQDGERVMDGGVDDAFVVEEFSIANDGGGW